MDAGPYRGGDKRRRACKGRDLIVYEEDREEKSISLAYTKSMETADIEKLEKAFQNIDTAKIQGAYAGYAAKGDNPEGKSGIYLRIIFGLILFSIAILVFFPVYFWQKKASDGADGI